MMVCKTRKWGNSLGLLIPKQEAENMKLQEGQTVVVEIVKAENPLKELFGFGRNNKITRKEFIETRALLESKRF